MSLGFIFGNSGAGKSYELYQNLIAEAKKNPRKKFLVLVPEQFTLQTQKELVSLHPDRGILNIDVLSFQRLAYRVFAETGTQVGKVLEETGKNLVLRKIAQEQQENLKVLGSNLKKTGYINEVKSLISELTQYAVSEEELAALTRESQKRPALYRKLRDVEVLYQAFHTYLAEQYITAEELLEVLCKAVEKSQMIRGSVIVLDGFTGFTPIQNKVLKEFLRYADRVQVTLTIDEREDPFLLQGEHELFYLSKKTVATLMKLAKEAGTEVEEPIWVHPSEKTRFLKGSALFALEQNLFRLRSHPFEGEQEEISLRVLKNPEEEVRWTAVQIHTLIRQKGYHYRDFAILTGDMESYSPTLEKVLGEFSIPCFLDYKRSVLKNPFIEFLRAVLEIAEQDFTYETVFRYLKSGLSGMARNDVDLLENYVLALGIRGRKKWENRFVRLYGKLTEEDLERINFLRESMMEDLLPFFEIQRKKDVDVRTRTQALYELAERLEIQKKLAVFEERFLKEEEAVLAKEYHQIYPIVMDLLDKLVDLLGEEKISVREYREILEAGFAEARVGVIPPGVDQVVAGDIERTRLKDVKVLFFLGVNEGNVPKHASRTGILSDLEREVLKKQGMELAPSAREQSYTQRFYLYQNLTKPSRALYVCCSLLDGNGKALRPSYLISTLRRLFPQLQVCGVRPEELAVPVTERQGIQQLIKGLGQWRQGSVSEHFRELYGWYAGQEEYEEKLNQLLEASFGGAAESSLGKAVAHALYGTVLENSVSRLEQYAACAYAHFLMYGLRLSKRETYEFAAVDMGNLFHGVLELFSRRLRASEYTWATLPEEVQELWVEECLDSLSVDYGNTILHSTARNEYAMDRMKRILKRTVWALSEQLKKGLFIPENYEISFSSVSDLEAVNITLSEEEKLHLRGRIDRVDTCEEEERVYVKVVDYKSGNTSFQLLSLYHGLQLQLVVYLSAAMELARKAHPGKKVEPAGIFYYQLQDPMLDIEAGEEPADVNGRLLEKLKMDGLVNADPEIIKKLDREMPGKSSVLPLSYNKDNSLRAGSSVASARQFEEMEAYVSRKIQKIGSEVLDGRIEVDPYELKGRTACDYCLYQSICGLDEKDRGKKLRRLKMFDEPELWTKIEEENRK